MEKEYSILADLRTVYQLALRPVRGATHAERMEALYASQAGRYDAFRDRRLHGRKELIEALPMPAGGVWVDLGGGTGSSLAYAGERLAALKRVYIVDLSPSLLAVARGRIEEMRWDNVRTVEADAISYEPLEGSADVVTFCYALTMIPNWFSAIDHAWNLLKPGGTLGVVDYYVSRRHASNGRVQHGWWTRQFWPLWFGLDHAVLSPDHLHYLHDLFEPVRCDEARGPVPGLPGLRVPYYLFIGRKPELDDE